MAKEKKYTFTWEGKNQEGEKMKGQMASTSVATVKTALREQGVTPSRVRKKASFFGFGSGQKRSKRIKQADIATFSRQIATMMTAGVPLVQSLDITAKGQSNPAMYALIKDIQTHIESGSTLAEALAKNPKYFDKLFVSLVQAGESSGALETLLDKIATYKEKTQALKASVKKALFYPTAVIITAFAVMGFMLYFVVPQFESLFQGFGADLPAFTQLVIHASEIMQKWWWVVILGLIIFIFLFVRARRESYRFRKRLDQLLLKIPIMGSILRKSAVARFARTLATMFSAGVPLTEALTSVASASGNIVFEEGIKQIRSQVASGQRMQLAMANTGLFPNLAQQMIAIGEESSALDDMCNRVAGIYENEVDTQVDALSTLLEPMVMVIIGLMVGGLIVAMYLPIFKLGSAI